MESLRIVLIGAGNVATQFGKELSLIGHEIIQVYSRTEKSAKILAEELNCEFTNNVKEKWSQE